MDMDTSAAGLPEGEPMAPPKRVRKPAAKKKKAIAFPTAKDISKALRKPRTAKRTKRERKMTATSPAVRSERADLRLTKAEKAKLVAKAKKTRRTVTSVMLELIEKMRP